MQGGPIGWEALAWAARAVSPWLMYWLLKLIRLPGNVVQLLSDFPPVGVDEFSQRLNKLPSERNHLTSGVEASVFPSVE